MKRHELLRGLHDVLQPRSYFEIGVASGASMFQSRTKSVGVDPFYNVTRELRCDVHLVRTTADEFFAREHPFAHFDEPIIDLAFIDGMHLSEYALRDFINTERFCHAGSVIVFDDMLPRNVIQAGRARLGSAERGAWTGDVYKIVDSLRTLRPDLIVLEMDTEPTGTVVVLVPDPRSRTLDNEYDSLVQEYVVPDPQVVPAWAITRSRAVRGEALLNSSVWPRIRELRDLRDTKARPAIREAYRRAGLTNPD